MLRIVLPFAIGIDPIAAEDARLNFGLPFLLTPTPTTEELWELGKAQRGAYDPITGAQNTPAFDVARSHFVFAQPWCGLEQLSQSAGSPCCRLRSTSASRNVLAAA